MGCVYCAEARKNFTSIDKVISKEQVKKISSLLSDYSLTVLFHGGEPTLLPVNYYKEQIEIFENSNKDVFFGIQTNAYKLDDEWLQFIKVNEKRLGVSVSLDGNNEMNCFRVDKDKFETFSVVCNNIRRMEKYNIKTGMICTIVSSSIGKEMELYRLLKEFGNLRFIKLNPCMDLNSDGTLPDWAVTPEEYFNFVNNFFTLMLQDGNWKSFYVEPIISILKNIQNVESSFCNYSYNKCSSFISLYPDGTITTCDNFNLEKGYLGNLASIESMSEILNFKCNQKLKENFNVLMKQCENCDIKNICKGGCIAIRNRYKNYDTYCCAKKNFIRDISNKIKEIVD